MTQSPPSLKNEFSDASFEDQIYHSDLFIGRAIKRRRKILGMTQSDLAVLSGVRFQQIQKYECGANKVSAARLGLLANALGVSISYFYPNCNSSEVDRSAPDVLRRLVNEWHTLDPKVQQSLLKSANSIHNYGVDITQDIKKAMPS